jgi:coenzyme F420 biosynthesis associated uncharacterized protein
MIDWNLARRVGGFVAGEPGSGIRLAGELDAQVEDARGRVIAYTGLDPRREIPPPEAIDRRAWLDANLDSMRALLEPLADKLASSGPLGGPARAVGGVVAALEVGVLAGYLSQRVLGQYDLVLLDPSRAPRLLMVAPNLRDAAQRLEVEERDLVAWVAIHEVTHAIQFSSVPWLADHLGGLIRELLEGLEVKMDPAALMRLPSVDDLRDLVDRVRDGGLITLVAGPERRAIIDRIQAAMAVIEGHAEHVMDAVGEDALPSLPQLREALDRRRRERPPALRMLERLFGLELKMRQYELGRRFCDGVVEKGGLAALNRVWSGPDALPTLAELEAPEAWLERTRVRAA